MRESTRKGSGTTVYAPNLSTRQRLLATLVPTLPDQMPAAAGPGMGNTDGTHLFMVSKDKCNDTLAVIG